MDQRQFHAFLIRQNLSKHTIRDHLSRCITILDSCSPFSLETSNVFLTTLWNDDASPALVNKYVQTIKKLCEFFEETWGEKIKKVKEDAPPRILMSEDEIETFIHCKLFDKFSMFWLLLSRFGSRPSEIASLTQDDIDFATNTMIIRKTKTRKGRQIPLAQSAIEPLKAYIPTLKSDYLFPNYRDPTKHISSGGWAKDFNARKKILGIKKHIIPYSLRHSYISRELEEDAGLFSVQDIVGHTKADTTRTYYRGSLKGMRKAMDKDTFNKKLLPPTKVLHNVEESLRSFHLDEDERFTCCIEKTNTSLKIDIHIIVKD